MREAPQINLHALRAFEAAARHQSFQRAAEELGLTPSAVSRHVRGLERDLGYPLFERLHRAVKLTEAGARYAARVTEGFAHLAASPHAPGRDRVVLDVDADLLRRWLLPRMTHETLDSLNVDIVTRARAERPRFLPVDTDVAITWGAFDEEEFVSEPFLRPQAFAIAAPSLGIVSINAIGSARLLYDRDDRWWRRLLGEAGLPMPEATASMIFDQCDLPIEAARLGLGVAVGDSVIAELDLRSGTLVRLDGPALPTRAYHLLRRRRGFTVASRRLLEWLKAEAAAFAEDDFGHGEG